MGTITGVPALSAKLPDHVKLGIASRFGDRLFESGRDVGDAYSIMAGMIGQHLATSNVPILGVEWVVQPDGNPVFGYAINPDSGIVVPLPQPLTMNPLDFAWIAPCATYVGVYIETEYGTGYVENYFYVQVPTVASFTSTTDVPYAGPVDGTTFLRFGTPPQPGIVIEASVSCGEGLSGTIGFLQLAMNARFGRDTDGTSWQWNLNGQFVLDAGPAPGWLFYQDQFADIGEGQTGQIDISDAPASQLGPPFDLVAAGDGDPVVPETYQTYLMFQPSEPGSLFVTLAVLTWTWEGYSQLENDGWSPVQEPGNTQDPAGSPSSALPAWTTNTMAGDWVVGMSRAGRAPKPG